MLVQFLRADSPHPKPTSKVRSAKVTIYCPTRNEVNHHSWKLWLMVFIWKQLTTAGHWTQMVARLVIPCINWNSLAILLMRLIIFLYQLLTSLHLSKLQHLQAQHLCYHTLHPKRPKPGKLIKLMHPKTTWLVQSYSYLSRHFTNQVPKNVSLRTFHIPKVPASLVCSGEALNMAPGATAAIGKAASRETLTAKVMFHGGWRHTRLVGLPMPISPANMYKFTSYCWWKKSQS